MAAGSRQAAQGVVVSDWRVAWRDAASHRGRFLVATPIFGIFSAIGGALWPVTAQITGAGRLVGALIGLAGGIVAVIAVLYAVALVRVPYKQRAAQREQIGDLEARLEEKDAEMRERFDSLRYRLEQVDFRGAWGEFRDEANGEMTDGYVFHITVRNGSPDPMWLQVEAVSITIGSSTALAGRRFDYAEAVVLPQSRYDFTWFPIPAPNPGGLPPWGSGQYTIVYGHPSGSTKFRMHHRFHINWEVEAGVARAVARMDGATTHEPVATP